MGSQKPLRAGVGPGLVLREPSLRALGQHPLLPQLRDPGLLVSVPAGPRGWTLAQARGQHCQPKQTLPGASVCLSVCLRTSSSPGTAVSCRVWVRLGPAFLSPLSGPEARKSQPRLPSPMPAGLARTIAAVSPTSQLGRCPWAPAPLPALPSTSSTPSSMSPLSGHNQAPVPHR